MEKFREDVLGKLLERLVLDSTRIAFAKLVSTTVYRLLEDKCVNNNRFCQLLLGRKSVGKTTLLIK